MNSKQKKKKKKKKKIKGKKKDFQNWKNFLQAHESTPFSNSFFSIVPHMQFEGMRDMYDLYSIPNLNKLILDFSEAKVL